MAGRETGKTGVEPVAALSLTSLQTQLSGHHLDVLGGFACENDPSLPNGTRSLILIGPKEPGYWAHLQAQPEWGGADPVDRWSRRVIGQLACDLGAKALFPFGGAPYHPFYAWALRTGQVWDSPVKLLIHARQGLMVSFRGALALKQVIDLPAPLCRPCDTCAKPCLGACPVQALTENGYDLAACHGYLDQPQGGGCMNGGCIVRRACPVSASYARMAEHSAYHMRMFHWAGKKT
jgi:epoxyqueuosine reductase